MKKLSAVAVLSGALLFALFSACSGGLIQPNNSTVKERFEDSKKGKTKHLEIPTAPDPDKFSFIWITDLHEEADHDDYLDQMGNFASNNSAAFILNSGDLTDDGKVKSLDYFLKREDDALTIPFYSALGNHDLYGDGWDAFKKKIGPSVTTFTYGNSFFMFVDSASCEIGTDQMDWIEDQLRAAKDADIPNKFVLSHFCLYDGDLETPTILCDPDERLHMFSLLKKYKVDYFLCGHKHYVEENKIDGTWHIMGGTASKYKKPYNDKPLMWYFSVDGDNVDYTKVHF